MVPEQFGQDGYCVLPDVLPRQICQEAIEEFERLRGDSGSHSLRNVHRSALVLDIANNSAAMELAKGILGPNATLVRAIFFDKIPGSNWSVPWHQDLTIALKERAEVPGFSPWSQKDGVWHVQPPAEILDAMVTVRLHLDDCSHDNGPVRVKPGSHRHGKIAESRIEGWNTQDVACTGLAGSALVMRPLLLHASSPAQNPAHRRVLHLEYASAILPEPLEWYLA